MIDCLRGVNITITTVLVTLCQQAPTLRSKRVNYIGKNVFSELKLVYHTLTFPSMSTCVRTKGAVRQSSRPESWAQMLLF